MIIITPLPLALYTPLAIFFAFFRACVYTYTLTLTLSVFTACQAGGWHFVNELQNSAQNYGPSPGP